MKNKYLTAISFTAVLSLLTACGGEDAQKNYKDGTYTGKSSVYEADEDGNGAGYGEAEIEIKGNKVVSCTFKMYEPDGTLKDESYGSDLTKENRLKAQKAVQSAEKYAASLVKKGNTSDVDVITGATISHDEFVEAVNNALKKAEVSE